MISSGSVLLLFVFYYYFLKNPYGSYAEGITIFLANNSALGEQLYGKITSSKDYFTLPVNYTPLYLFFLSPFLKFFSNDLLAARLVNGFLFVVVCILAYKISYQFFSNKRAALLAICIICIPSLVSMEILRARVDVLGVVLNLLGFYLIQRKESTRNLILAVLCFIAAWLTKPIYFAGFLTVLVVFLIKKSWQMLGFFMTMYLSLIVISIYLLQLTTNNNFLQHLFSIFPGSYVDFYQVILIFLGAAIFHYIFFLPAILMTKKIGWRHPLIIYLFFASLISLLYIRVGSNYHYFFEPLVLMAILSSAYIMRFLFTLKQDAATILKKMILLCIAVIFFIGFPVMLLERQIWELRQYQKAMPRLWQAVETFSEPILYENFGLAPEDSGSRPFEFFMRRQMTDASLWKQEDFIYDLNNKRFSAIILETDIFTNNIYDARLWRFHPDVKKALLDSYAVSEKIPSNDLTLLWILTPKAGDKRQSR